MHAYLLITPRSYLSAPAGPYFLSILLVFLCRLFAFSPLFPARALLLLLSCLFGRCSLFLYYIILVLIGAYPQQPAGQYTVAARPPVVGYHHHAALHHPNSTPHYQGHSPYEVAAVVPTAHMQHLVEQQAAEEMRKSAKRAANRRSASTCRARKKFLVETMAEANDRMRRRSLVLSLLPDMILAMRRDGVVTYASDNCREFLDFKKEVRSGQCYRLNMFVWVEVLEA